MTNMNNPSNENEKDLTVQETSVGTNEADSQLMKLFAETETVDGPADDPFFAPLPEISAEDVDEDTDENTDEDAADTDGNASEEQEQSSDEAAPTQEKKPKRKIGKVLGIAAGSIGGAVLLVFCVLCVILFRLSTPVTVDLDETVSLGLLQTHPVLSSLTEANPSPDAIDTSSIGEKELQLTFFGFLPRTVTVSVCDMTLPAVTAYRMTVGVGVIPEAAECVRSCEDKTVVTHAFAETPDTMTPGEHTALLLSTDGGGNTVQTEVTITVSEDACTQYAEFGTDRTAIAAQFSEAYPDYQSFDLAGIDDTLCGTYSVLAQSEDAIAVLSLVLADTTAPTGRVQNYNLLSGTTLKPEDFVAELRDASEVALSYQTAPDYNSLAPQTVVVLAEDAHGNTAEFSCALQIWNISGTLTAECGTTLNALRDALFTDMRAAGAALPTFDSGFDPASLAPGTYEVALHGKYSTPRVSLTMVDTVAPALTTQPVTAYIGHTLEPQQFVSELSDATEVVLSFKAEPDTAKAGKLSVTVVAVDAGGNKSESTTTATIIADTTAPQIYGVNTIYAQQNGTVSYRSGVSAYDNADGNVTVKIDASGVDVSKVGKYTVIYTATDKAGNTAMQKATVYVTGANEASLTLYADEILAAILTPGMNDTQKASAIYNWCVAHLRYSTSTSHLMGKYIEAAYSGFTTHIGNCYTYYAVASVLLTRAGIENIEIQRNNPNAPHYWNLVKINGNWYHLDTCPKWKSHPIKAFLLTDWQVKQYSLYEVEGYYSFDASLYPATP